MSSSPPPHPEWSPKKHGPKRYFKGLIMPPVIHTPGAVPEEFQPKVDARNGRGLLALCVVILILLSGWIGASIRKHRRAQSSGASACCGCDQRHDPGSCSKAESCKSSPSSGGCGRAGTPSGAHGVPASQPIQPKKGKVP